MRGPGTPAIYKSRMRKTDKKHENAIRLALTEVCEQALEQVPGFIWLTHEVNYQRFPDSLQVICVFDNRESLQRAVAAGRDAALQRMVVAGLGAIGIRLKAPAKQIRLATEMEM